MSSNIYEVHSKKVLSAAKLHRFVGFRKSSILQCNNLGRIFLRKTCGRSGPTHHGHRSWTRSLPSQSLGRQEAQPVCKHSAPTNWKFSFGGLDLPQSGKRIWVCQAVPISMPIFNSSVLSQTPTEAAGPWTLASALHGAPLYLPAFIRTKLYCLVTRENGVQENCLWRFLGASEPELTAIPTSIWTECKWGPIKPPSHPGGYRKLTNECSFNGHFPR